MPKKSTGPEVLGNIFRENGLSPEMIEKKDSLIEKNKKMLRPYGITDIRPMSDTILRISS